MKRTECWDDEEVKQRAEDGWDGLKRKTINKWVDQIPQILNDCLELEGGMTGH